MIPGEYITSLAGHRTFIPTPLPPGLQLHPKLLRLTEEAIYLLGQAETCGITLPSTDLLIYSSLQREAIASSTIEGTIATPKELVLFQVSHKTENMAAKEVANYQISLEWGYQQIAHRELTTNFLQGLHQRLLWGVRGEPDAGNLRIVKTR